MKKKLKLDKLNVASFVTVKAEDNDRIKGGGDTNNRACPTAYACPSEWPVCTHPYYGC